MLKKIGIIVFLTLGVSNIYAAQADWNILFHAKYRDMAFDPKDSKIEYENYFWQKTELLANFQGPDKVTFYLGVFHQNYWGTGRMWGFNTGGSIDAETGFSQGYIRGESTGYATTGGRYHYNSEMGVSAAWIKYESSSEKFILEVGRKIQPRWGSGAFLGGRYSRDQIALIFKDKIKKANISVSLAYEDRNVGSTQEIKDNLRVAHLDFLYSKEDLSFGLSFQPHFSGKNSKYGTYTPLAGSKNSVYFLSDAFLEKTLLAEDDLSISLFTEIFYGFGVLDQMAGLTNYYRTQYSYNSLEKIGLDSLSGFIKISVDLKDLLVISPEFGITKSAKKGDTKTLMLNNYSFNEYNGSDFTVGSIYCGIGGGYSIVTAGNVETLFPGNYYAKINLDLNFLSLIDQKLTGYAAFVYASLLENYKKSDGTQESKKFLAWEVDFGLAYAINSAITLSVDLAYAKWGKSSILDESSIFKAGHTPGAVERQDYYLGTDIKVKF